MGCGPFGMNARAKSSHEQKLQPYTLAELGRASQAVHRDAIETGVQRCGRTVSLLPPVSYCGFGLATSDGSAPPM